MLPENFFLLTSLRRPHWLDKHRKQSEYTIHPYYPLDTIGTMPRAYDMFRAYEGTEGRKIKIKK
jgi:hypothetical protein